MKRLLIMTVGKTHSGKTTFAKELEKKISNTVVIDQDNHAEFLHSYYQALIPKQGPNLIKYAITRTIVDYAINETDCHIIRCNSNRNGKDRLKWLSHYHKKGFISILVNFNIPEHILKERIANSKRNMNIIRAFSTFEEVLVQQIEESNNGDIMPPTKGEANHLFTINNSSEVDYVIEKIRDIAQSPT
ncbi:AAA family ATPase [Alkalihalobacillus sp. AL-G]|uniref:AAA family ATPase n=1 Tax=Alkalihalobacillus sp. AL-G TaxID=2926399 RepID=UPI00272C896B|nr:AAA family ATPase [Alkalihalobacillus sp. AL-G]WLD94484.1 AAA family ATPase [Alkalihalobacillus sp. AL-G]